MAQVKPKDHPILAGVKSLAPESYDLNLEITPELLRLMHELTNQFLALETLIPMPFPKLIEYDSVEELTSKYAMTMSYGSSHLSKLVVYGDGI